MKKLSVVAILLALVVSLFITYSANAAVYVHGYTKKNGTYVAPHYRSDPDGIFSNNWSTVGNVNPYTGKEGTKQYPDYPYSYTPSYSYNTNVAPSCATNQSYNYLTYKCECNYGFVLSNSQCVLPDQYCQNLYGANSSYYNNTKQMCMYCSGGTIINRESDTCSCPSGQNWDGSKCILQAQITNVSNGNDYTSYYYCKEKNGSNSYFTGEIVSDIPQCKCLAGYNFNDKSQCVEKNSSPAVITDLKFGSKNRDVKTLQTILIEKGYYSNEITGYFGKITETALKKFQTDNGLTSLPIIFTPLVAHPEQYAKKNGK